MSDLSADDVREIARLARLRLDDAQVDALCRELGDILDHMQELSALDTEGVEPMTHASVGMRLRADEVAPSLPIERALAGAPRHDEDSFAVPAVITSGE